jgi:Cu2+-containing amine oxidase
MIHNYMSDLTKNLEPVLTPLAERKEQLSIKAALAHLSIDLEQEPNRRVRVFGSELRIEKPPERETVPKRLIRVIVADYDNRQIHDVTVDSNGSIANCEVLARHQPAFHDEEVREAREIAERDERIANLAKLRGSFVGAFAPHADSEKSRRVVGLHYLVATGDGQARPLATISVDLYEQEIVHFRDDTEDQNNRRHLDQP